MALFCSDGGPGSATDLVRVDVEGNGPDMDAWQAASADRRTVRSGWKPYPNAQLDIGWKGELFMVDAGHVPYIQQQLQDAQMKRPLFIISTEGKSREQMKAEAREALRKYLGTQK